MSHFLVIICFSIISVRIQSVYGSTHALIGNYSQLNPNDCGITRFVPNLNNSCFKWHTTINVRIKGRNATEDEVPWIVYIEVKKFYQLLSKGSCSGSLIGDQWVLTASHCIVSDDPKDYYIYAGINSFRDPRKTYLARANQVYKHPDYSELPSLATINDIGLIKLDRSISSIKPIKGNQQFNRFKSICLPQKNIFNTEQEIALFGGWGRVDRNKWPLQVGIRKLFPSDDYSFWYSTNYITTVKMDNKTLMCMGDSGGPLWQYDKRRAVIIGVSSHGFLDERTLCESNGPEGALWFVRVSKYIDWIKNITELK